MSSSAIDSQEPSAQREQKRIKRDHANNPSARDPAVHVAPASTPASTMTAAQQEISTHFSAFRDEIDEHNDRRERLIKASRDVTSLSKKVIFLLHRFDIRDFGAENPSSKTTKLFQDAESKLDEIVAILRATAMQEGLGPTALDGDPRTARHRSDRYERNIGGGLEEFIEAISFYHYLRTRTLISQSQVQARFRAQSKSESQFYSAEEAVPSDLGAVLLMVPTRRYLLGLSDLTGELMRFATNAVGQGDTGRVVRQVLMLTRALRDSLDPFIPLVYDLKKKQIVTNQSLRKIEDILYALAVRSSEYGSDPEALKEMVRRSLASSSNDRQNDDEDD
ncbi:Translin [Testicularia cyperi]|uniref:Translin n=1 Tax=Testicularia cyperi TaxID=1882483 RepID=A0A317XK53_9BASI|nr:Translin [Testicularia cyperi]